MKKNLIKIMSILLMGATLVTFTGCRSKNEIVKKVIKRVNNYLYDLSKYQNTKGYIIFQNRDEQKNRNEIISILKRKGYYVEVIEPSHCYEWGGIQISW